MLTRGPRASWPVLAPAPENQACGSIPPATAADASPPPRHPSNTATHPQETSDHHSSQ